MTGYAIRTKYQFGYMGCFDAQVKITETISPEKIVILALSVFED